MHLFTAHWQYWQYKDNRTNLYIEALEEDNLSVHIEINTDDMSCSHKIKRLCEK